MALWGMIVTAAKTNWRRGGLGPLMGLVFVLGVVCFVAFDGQLILAAWQQTMMRDYQNGLTMTLPYIVPLLAFRFLASLVAFVAGLGAALTLNSSFRQIALGEIAEFQIMSYLGGTDRWISSHFAWQPTLVSIVSLPFAGLMANVAYLKWLAPVQSRETFGGPFQLFLATGWSHLLVIVAIAGIVFWRNYRYVQRQLQRRFEDPHKDELVGSISEE